MDEKFEKKAQSILGNWIIRNILLAAAFFAVLILAANMFLGFITNHGRTIEVPDLTSMSVEDASHLASRRNLKVEVIDSIYVRRMTRGAVFSQNPKAGDRVKKGRRILLTINANTAKKVNMPNLVGYSVRQAKAELSSRGLALGRLIYVNDIATNNVLRQIYRNRQIRPGVQIESGSEIVLEVGLNQSDCMTYVPDVNGMKYLRAVDAVHDHYLNIRNAVFDKNIRNYTDSLNAIVYKQTPGASRNPLIMGSEVTIYLKKDTNEE